jgi:pimeloyl-ACP methyl ester carboxylesterase
MPTARNGDVDVYYETAGDGETVAFVGDAGYGAWQWGWQHAAVGGPYRSLVADLRGTGRSGAPDGPYAVSDLVEDLTTVLSDAGVRRAHLVGCGLGGMVALEAARTTGRAASLTLVGTAASGAGLDLEPLYGDPSDPGALRESLTPALSERFRREQPDVVEQIVEWRRTGDADADAWRAQTAAAEAYDVRDRLYEVTVPALVVHGEADPVWPPARGERLADDLPRGEFVPVADAKHLVTVETSRIVNDRLLGFLDALDS